MKKYFLYKDLYWYTAWHTPGEITSRVSSFNYHDYKLAKLTIYIISKNEKFGNNMNMNSDIYLIQDSIKKNIRKCAI